jgi:hypothetical protein
MNTGISIAGVDEVNRSDISEEAGRELIGEVDAVKINIPSAKTVSIPVRMTETTVIEKGNNERGEVLRRTYFRYDIESATGSDEKLWSFWVEGTPCRASIQNDDLGRSFATLMFGYSAFLFDLSAPDVTSNTMELAKSRDQWNKATFRVEFSEPFGREPFQSDDALVCDLFVNRIYHKSGRLRIEIHGHDPKDVFTMELNEGQWSPVR